MPVASKRPGSVVNEPRDKVTKVADESPETKRYRRYGTMMREMLGMDSMGSLDE